MQDTEPGPVRLPGDFGTDPAPDGFGASVAGDTAGAAAEDDGNSFTALRDDLTALVEDARTYAEAEIAFQKTRATLVGKRSARALVLLVLALVLLNLALIALAVGAVIALAPLVTIWGAIAIVVGVLLLGVAALVLVAARDGKAIAAMFEAGDQP